MCRVYRNSLILLYPSELSSKVVMVVIYCQISAVLFSNMSSLEMSCTVYYILVFSEILLDIFSSMYSYVVFTYDGFSLYVITVDSSSLFVFGLIFIHFRSS